mgnify:CR=1 FL=1|jgi:hypothetical protein
MNTFVIVLTVMASSVNVQPNTPVTLQPNATIEVHGTTLKNAQTNCLRIEKAMAASQIIAFCAPNDQSVAQADTSSKK